MGAAVSVLLALIATIDFLSIRVFEIKDSTSRTIVNSILFPVRKPRPLIP